MALRGRGTGKRQCEQVIPVRDRACNKVIQNGRNSGMTTRGSTREQARFATWFKFNVNTAAARTTSRNTRGYVHVPMSFASWMMSLAKLWDCVYEEWSMRVENRVAMFTATLGAASAHSSRSALWEDDVHGLREGTHTQERNQRAGE